MFRKPTKADLIQEIMNTPSLLPSPFNPSKLRKQDLEQILSTGHSKNSSTSPNVVNTADMPPERETSPTTFPSPVLSPAQAAPLELGSETDTAGPGNTDTEETVTVGASGLLERL